LLAFLAKRKNSSFPERKPSVSASGNKDFPDGNWLMPTRIKRIGSHKIEKKNILDYIFKFIPNSNRIPAQKVISFLAPLFLMFKAKMVCFFPMKIQFQVTPGG